jgi:hypothetical protein
MKEGAAGGGAITWFKRTEALPAYVWLGFAGLAAIAKFAGFTGGPFLYCTRAAFDATGGFPANMYWAEETPFGLALKREGKFVVPWTPIIMSGRRFRASAKENSFKKKYSPIDPLCKAPGTKETERTKTSFRQVC